MMSITWRRKLWEAAPPGVRACSSMFVRDRSSRQGLPQESHSSSVHTVGRDGYDRILRSIPTEIHDEATTTRSFKAKTAWKTITIYEEWVEVADGYTSFLSRQTQGFFYLGTQDRSNETEVESPTRPEPAVPKTTVREEGWPGEVRRCRKGHRRSRTPRHQRFGYQITDLDAFLTKASIETPGNIPVVLSAPCLLYQTQAGGYQEEVSLPLGMVVNAVFKNQAWLYVQTPHGEEGYVRYASCLPLGILPPESSAPWESQSDIFPKPTGNRIEERLGTRSECGSRAGQRYRRKGCGEENVDSLYLAAQEKTRRQVLLVVAADYNGKGRNTLSVSKGDVVTLVSSHLRDWFWVRTRDGKEGFIPAVVAGHGFL